MSHLLDGRQLAATILQRTKERMQQCVITPGIAAILVGDNEASALYVRIKEKRCKELGIHFEKIIFNAETKSEEIIAAIHAFNLRADIHAILVQLPLPAQLSASEIISVIDPAKDVDGFHPDNIKWFMSNDARAVQPVLIKAILALINAAQTPLSGKHAVILGKSDVFMRPLGSALLRAKMHVVWQTLSQPNWQTFVHDADVLITALGKPHFITASMIKPGAILIDAGIERKDGVLFGDIAPEAQEIAAFATPVPGGVGPVTVAMLLENIVTLAERSLRRFSGGEVLLLSGDLGSGKTTFAKAVGNALGVRETITSPTFTLMNIYNVPSHETIKQFCHIDTYRIKETREFDEIGVLSYIGKHDVLTLIEWPEKLLQYLQEKNMALNARMFTFSGEGSARTVLEKPYSLQK